MASASIPYLCSALAILLLSSARAEFTELVRRESVEAEDFCFDAQKLLAKELKRIELTGSSIKDAQSVPLQNGISFTDLKVPAGESRLAKELTPFLGNPLTEEALRQIKKSIAYYYQKHNYPLTAVQVLSCSNGILRLKIIESKLGRLTVTGNHKVSDHAIAKWIRLQPDETINELTLIRDVNWINANPFTKASILYRPGEAPNTTDVDIQVMDRKKWRSYAGVDNTGIPLIGRTRCFAGINLNDIFFPRHTLSFQFTTANSFPEFKSYTFQYAAPFPWRHTLSFYGAYATVDPKTPPLRSQGRTYQLSGRYTVPQWFSRFSIVDQISYELGFDFKGTNNNVIFGEDTATPILSQLAWIGQFEGAFTLNRARNHSKTGAGVELFWSPGRMLPHQTDEDFNNLRPNASPKYFYTRLFLTYDYTFQNKINLYFLGRLQLASANLLPSEQFGLGGYSTVRGYDERVVNGDNAVCGNFEWRFPSFPVFFSKNSKVQDAFYCLLFADAGYGWDHEQIPGLPIAQTLVGVGPGLRYNIFPYLVGRFDLGFALHPVVNDTALARVHFSLVLNY